MMTVDRPFNRLTPADEERLHLLQEECAEVIHIAAKILRHGFNSRSPKTPDGPTNRQMLAMEVGQVLAVLQLLYGGEDINPISVHEHEEQKLRAIGKYLHHNDVPTLLNREGGNA